MVCLRLSHDLPVLACSIELLYHFPLTLFVARARAIFCTNVKLFTDIPVQVYGSLVVCMNVFRLG